MALQDHTGQDPETQPTYWSLLAQKGDKGLEWRGAWDNATAYVSGDAVTRQGSAYVALQDHTGQDPEAQPTYWSLLAQKGDKGDKGDQGDAGATGAQGTQTTAFIAGIQGVSTGVNDAIPVLIDSNGQLGTVSSSRRYKQDIQPMGEVSAALLKLRPVTFLYKKPYADGAKPIQYGLIAEEVAEVMPGLTVFNAKGQPETVTYHLLPSLLLNEVQRQQKIIKAQAEADRRQRVIIQAQAETDQRHQKTIQMQAKLVAALEQRLRSIEAKLARLATRQATAQPAALGRRAEAGALDR